MMRSELKCYAQRWAAHRFRTFSDPLVTTAEVVPLMPDLIENYIKTQAVLNDIPSISHQDMMDFGVAFYEEFLAEPLQRLYGLDQQPPGANNET